MNTLERLERADRVRRMLGSDEWINAWEAYRAVLMDTIETTQDDEKALQARRMLQVARQVRSHLELLISDGQVAAADVVATKSKLKLA